MTSESISPRAQLFSTRTGATSARALLLLIVLSGPGAVTVLFAGGDARAQQPPTGKPVVAVIADGSERVAPLADLLFAELSKSERLNLVERAELKKILAEQELQASFDAKGGKSRRQLGSLLRADFLVLLRIGDADESPAVETVIAETRFGYRLIKQPRKWDPKQVDLAAAEIAILLDGSLARFSCGVSSAVAVPPFFSRNLTHHFDHLQGALARVVEVEAARRPGCAVVELEEARAIAEELAIGAGDDKVMRPLPYYLVGEFRHETLQPNSPVSVTLRLRHGTEQLAELSSKGFDGATAAKFVRKTTNDLLNEISNGGGAGIPATDSAKEVRTLLRRAQGFLEVGAAIESASLYETALLLDPDNIDVLDGAVESYVRITRLPGFHRYPANRYTTPSEKSIEAERRELRLSEHLTRLVRLKKYDSFYAMRDRVKPAAGLLGQARGDFLLNTFPHTWREEGWRDHNIRSRYTDSWFDLIDVIGVPAPKGAADKNWFDYRLKLFQAAYKGKSRWYARWVLLPKDCDDGSGRYTAEEVRQYVKLHESFVERFKQVCDDPWGLHLSLEYARLKREFLHRRKQPDLVVLTELTWLYCQCEAAGIWEGELAFLDLLNRTAQRHYACVPRFKPPTVYPDRPPLPKAGDAIHVGRLRFQPVKLHYTGRDGQALGSHPNWRGSGGGITVLEGLVKCSPGIDVLWGSSMIVVMKEKDHPVEIFRDTKAEISDVCFDGKWLWAGTRTGRILLVDPLEGSVRVIGREQGVPDSRMAMVICPLEPGRICAVGAFPPHARAWCAVVTTEDEVHVFHEARRIAQKADDAGADCAFKPCWVFPIKSADGKAIDRLLLCRDGLTVHRTTTSRYPNRYTLAYHPLMIDPRRLTVEVLETKMPLGIRDLQRKDVVQTREFLFFGAMAVKTADMRHQIAVINPQGERLGHPPSHCAFQLGSTLYLPSDDGSPWIEVDPKTVVGEILAEGRGVPENSNYTYFPSWHYGIFGLSRFTDGTHYRVSVGEKTAGENN